MSWLATPSELRERGVMGLNRRNLDYLSGFNDRRAYPLVDNKLLTKQLAARAGMPTPALLHHLSRQYEIEAVREHLADLPEFVIKPAQGSGGRGILVIVGREGEYFVKSSREQVDLRHIKRLLTNIISGLHSLGGRTDSAIVESLVNAHPMFDSMTAGGVPDIRVIVFQGYPVMAMLRLGTRASDGRANLHQGAVGVGLDIRSGRSVGAVQDDHAVTQHPDSHVPLEGICVPDWPALLRLVSRCFDVTGLGYLGCDIVIDAQAGPVLLEMNARPGLSIQIANGTGLDDRLRAVLARDSFAPTVDERVAFALDGLGGAVG